MKIPSRSDVEALDRSDPLAPMRGRFHLPEGMIYLDGNSLGPMARSVPAAMDTTLREEWATGLISSWNNAGWWDLAIT